MIEWQDDGIVLTVRAHGESSVILDVLTAQHGLASGLVRGGVSRKMAPHLQPGGQVQLTWKARLEGHLGAFSIEPIRGRAGALMSDRAALAGLQSISVLCAQLLPERVPVGDFYPQTVQLLDLMAVTEAWPLAYLRWEVGLLDALGYGLALDACAVTGVTKDLAYVSPKSGCAVSVLGAGQWVDRLLPLPQCLLPGGEGPDGDIAVAMRTTGHFLAKALGAGRDLPEARRRLLDLFAR